METGSHDRNSQHKKWRYDDLVRFMVEKEMLIRWLMEESLMAKERLCPMCDGEMGLGRAKGTRRRFLSGKEAGLKIAR